jgi:sporulation protein YlmC with PRC-barrel domain
MKTLRLIGAMLAVLGTAIVPTSAQTQSTTVQVSKLVGTRVKSVQGEEIGVIKDVVIDRNSGCMAYTVLSSEGGARATGGGKLVAVPWAVYSPSSGVSVLTTTVDRERIYNAPVFDYARIDEYSRPDYITNVYSYYGVSQGGVGVGVSSASTTTGVSGSTTTTSASGAATGRADAAGSPAQGSSPAATTSPAATRSPVERESPAGKASPRPHATASPHARGEATASPSSRRERAARGKPEEAESPSSGTREERGTKARPEETESQRRGAELQEESPRGTRESAREAATPSERTREGTRPHRKTERPESASPPPGPEE